MLVLAALVGGVYCAEMQNVWRLCYTLTVKCSFSMLCTDFKISIYSESQWLHCRICIGKDVLFALNVMYY